jgi:hypothetical protein
MGKNVPEKVGLWRFTWREIAINIFVIPVNFIDIRRRSRAVAAFI